MTRLDDAAPVLALVHAVGLEGFSPPASAPPSIPGPDASTYAATAPNEPVLALVAAAGMPGFKCSEVRTPSPSNDPITALIHAAGLSGFKHSDDAEASVNDDPVRNLIAQAGLAGFKAVSPNTSVQPSPTKARVVQTVSPLQQPRSAAGVVKRAMPSTKRLSKLDYAVVHIAAVGGASALASLEERMGRPLSADQPGGACYSMQQRADGSSTRAFAMMSHERRVLDPFIGELGSPALRLSFEPIDVGAYKRAGPGATGSSAQGEPMQMAPSAITALVGAMK